MKIRTYLLGAFLVASMMTAWSGVGAANQIPMATVVDPVDQCFWVFNQHAGTRGSGTTGGCNGRPAIEDGRWATAFGKFCFACLTSPFTLIVPTTLPGTAYRSASITVTEAGDVAATGDLTLEGQTIAFENGFTADGDLSVLTGFCPP